MDDLTAFLKARLDEDEQAGRDYPRLPRGMEAVTELQLPPGARSGGPWDRAGDCIMTRHADGILTVDQADPRILISAELFDELISGIGDPEVTVTGDVLRIEASNRTVIYRIGEKVPGMRAYYAEWPD